MDNNRLTLEELGNVSGGSSKNLEKTLYSYTINRTNLYNHYRKDIRKVVAVLEEGTDITILQPNVAGCHFVMADLKRISGYIEMCDVGEMSQVRN